MRHARQGLLLFELLMFVGVFSFFLVVVMQCIANATLLFSQTAKSMEVRANYIAAIDWLMKDFQDVDVSRDTIKTEQNTECSILGVKERIVWKIKDNILMRIIQRYDTLEKKWKKPNTVHVVSDVAALYVQSLRFGVVCTLTAGDMRYTVSEIIAFRNGIQ